MSIRRDALLIKKDSLIMLSTIMLVAICFSNCTVVRYFEPYMWPVLIFFLVLCLKGKRMDLLHAILLLFIMFLGVNAALSYDRNITLGYLQVFLVGLLFSVVVTSEEKYIKFQKMCFAISLFIAITIILELFNNQLCSDYLWFLGEFSTSKIPAQALSKANEIAYGAYSGVAFEKADAAYYMNIGIACVIARYTARKKMDKWEGIFLFIFAVALLLTGKRMLFLIAVFDSLLLFLISGVRKKGQKLIVVILAVLGIFIITASIIPELTTTFQRLSMSAGEDDAMLERYVKWHYALQLFNRQPVIGYGYGTYNEACLTVGYPAKYYAHNVYIQMLAEVGIVGTAIMVALMIVNLYVTLKYVLKRKWLRYDRDYELALFSLFMQVMIIIYGLSGNVLYYKGQLIMYLVVIAIINLIRKKSDYDVRSEPLRLVDASI